MTRLFGWTRGDQDAATAVVAGAGDGGKTVGLALEAEIAEEGEDDGLLIVDDIGLGNIDLTVGREGANARDEEGVFGAAASDKKGRAMLSLEDGGHLEGDVLDDGAEERGDGGRRGGEQGEKGGKEPFLAEALGRLETVVGKAVEALEQLSVEISLRGEGAVAVERKVEEAREVVECHVARRDIERQTAVVMREGDVGEAAKIEAGIVGAKEETVADGDERSTLAAESDVELAEIVGHREARLGGDGVAVGDLGGEAELRLMEDGVAMRGDKLSLELTLVKEEVDAGAEIVAQLDVGESILEGRGTLERGKAADPLRRIGEGVGREEAARDRLWVGAGNLAKCDIEAVKRSS